MRGHAREAGNLTQHFELSIVARDRVSGFVEYAAAIFNARNPYRFFGVPTPSAGSSDRVSDCWCGPLSGALEPLQAEGTTKNTKRSKDTKTLISVTFEIFVSIVV